MEEGTSTGTGYIQAISLAGEQLSAAILDCQRCPRLLEHCQRVAQEKRRAYRDQDYWGRPVPSFGPLDAEVLLVGLAPGAHGANRTGRMFTGDRSGEVLYAALHEVGLASQAESTGREDGLRLLGVRVTNAVHCAPPDNKPTSAEIAECRSHLLAEFAAMLPPQGALRVLVALGGLAYGECRAVLGLLGWEAQGKRVGFAHGAEQGYRDEAGRELRLLGSYHPSQQNVFTGRLTPAMLREVLGMARG